MEGILDSWVDGKRKKKKKRERKEEEGKKKKREKKKEKGKKKSGDAVNVFSSVIQSDYARVSGYL